MPTAVPDPDLSAIVPAAGHGHRLGLGPKALLNLAGQPLIAWVVRKLQQIAGEVIVAGPPDRLDEITAWCPGCLCIPGGNSRQDSVSRLAEAVGHPWVLLHDVARPFASVSLLSAVVDAARLTGAAGAFLQPDVPVARIQDGVIVQGFSRNEVGIFQAPQAFARDLLRSVQRRADREGWKEQSTVQLLLRAGHTVRAVPGERTNIKLTCADDWAQAQLLTSHLA